MSTSTPATRAQLPSDRGPHSLPGYLATMSSAASTSSSGRAVPLSLPLESPTLRVLQRLRTKAHDLEGRLIVLARLQQQLDELPDEPRYDAVVPLPGTSSLAYSSSASGGRIVETNTVTVNLGGGDNDEDSGYWVEYSAKQAKGVARRKAEGALMRRLPPLGVETMLTCGLLVATRRNPDETRQAQRRHQGG